MTSGYEIIIPFLREIEHLLFDPTVSEIMRNGDGKWFVERNGRLEYLPDIDIGNHELLLAVEGIARRLGKDIGDDNLILDASLPDGSRVSAAIEPISPEGLSLNIRKFDSRRFSIDELARIGSVAPEALELITGALRDERNVLISGGTATGKTTLLNALSPYLGDVRIALIEDTSELQLHQQNVLRLVAKRTPPVVTIRDLLIHAMRRRPDRIIVGEVRGAEAFELLNSLNSGHGGSMATIHAQTARRAVGKLAMYTLQSGEVPLEAIDPMIGESIDLIVQLKRDRATGHRHVSEIVELVEYDRKTKQHVFFDLWPVMDERRLGPLYGPEEDPAEWPV